MAASSVTHHPFHRQLVLMATVGTLLPLAVLALLYLLAPLPLDAAAVQTLRTANNVAGVVVGINAVVVVLAGLVGLARRRPSAAAAAWQPVRVVRPATT